MQDQEILRLSLADAVRRAYWQGQEDESLEPIVRVDPSGIPVGRPEKGDSMIFYDIRGEREVEITRALVEDDFSHFPTAKGLGLNFVTMITYERSLPVRVAFPAEEKLKNTLVETIIGAGKRLLKIAESEKAIHIGYFLNGKQDSAFSGEDRIIVPSPEVQSYEERPEMSVERVADEVLRALADPSREVIIANLANVDVVGHSEDKAAVLSAVEAVDRALGRIAAQAEAAHVAFVVTADHGTVEEWLYPDGQPNTGHTKSPVPFIFADFSGSAETAPRLRVEGELADVAPTLLELLGIDVPTEMTGQSLFESRRAVPGRAPRLLVLILDGWGQRDEAYGNLIREARTPHFDDLWARHPHARLQAAGEAVGMPAHTVGNSEAGHLHLGAGRRVWLDRVRIDRAIDDGSFRANDAYLWAMDEARRAGRALHLMGIVSHYSSHGTIRHLFELLRLAKDRALERVFIHAFIGRRGERAESGAAYVQKVEDECRATGLGEVVTVMGRFWSLDREENWDRVEKAYRAIVRGEGLRVCPPRV